MKESQMNNMQLEKLKNDQRIMTRLAEEANEALSVHPTDWFVICGQGSINYPGLSDEESDVDSKLLTIPSFRDIVQNKTPRNNVHEMQDNKEHVDMKDVREYMRIARKQNINFVEVFFTNYWIANQSYKDIWLEMMRHAEEFVHMNPYRTLKCCKGMCYEKQHALEHRYPSRAYYIDAFGYDGKQLQHAIRIYEFAKKYTEHYSFRDCLTVDDPEWLLAVKRHKADLSLDGARVIMDGTVAKMEKLEAEFNKHHKDEEYQPTRELYDELLYELIKRAVKQEIE